MAGINNFQRILIAIDDSPYSEKAAQYGFHLAHLMNAHVALLNVMDPPSATYSGDPLLGQQPLVIPEIINIQEEASRSILERYGSIWDSENPRIEILATAEEWKADLIILGTHGRTGFDHFISGSVAEGVARRSVCPVLIVPNKTDQ
jgi:nucleotide-binding universal stress UspA family protein